MFGRLLAPPLRSPPSTRAATPRTAAPPRCAMCACRRAAPAAIGMRLERLATRLQKRGQTVDRAIEVDICYPQDLAEYDRLAGHAIVLLSAVTRTERELPLQRVYVGAGGVETPRVSIGGVRDALSRAAKSVLGGCREDRFYLAPVSALSQDGAALADRAVNRTGFRVHQLPSRAPEWTRTATAPPDAKPDPAAVAALLKREDPGYDIR